MWRHFCSSVKLAKTLKKPAPRTKVNNFSTPVVHAEKRGLMRSCVSFRIGVSSVTWSRLELSQPETNSSCKLTHWEHREICEKKLHINDLIQRCLNIDHIVPGADCYIFENPQTATTSTNPGNTVQQNINVQKAQITAILSYAMARRNFNGETNEVGLLNVYYLRRFLSARLFKHLVGSERVSCEQTVLKMMQEQNNILENDALNSYRSCEKIDENDTQCGSVKSSSDVSQRCKVNFSKEQCEMFTQAQSYHREFLGQALLLNLAFIRLELLQDSQSIAAVSRTSSKNKETDSVKELRS